MSDCPYDDPDCACPRSGPCLRQMSDDAKGERERLIALLRSRDLEIAEFHAMQFAIADALAALAPAQAQRCPTCGTHEVSLHRTCHNSACAAYAEAVTVYEGWHAQAQRVEPELGRCCYGGMRTREACASCAAWRPSTESAASAAPVVPKCGIGRTPYWPYADKPAASAEDAPAKAQGGDKLRSMANHLLTATALTGAELIHIAAALDGAADELDRLIAANAALHEANATLTTMGRKACDIADALQARVDAATRAINALVGRYIANRGTDSEFICCVTPDNRGGRHDATWKLWDDAIAALASDKEEKL